MGDFNARVGTNADGASDGVMGRFGGDRFAAVFDGRCGRFRYEPQSSAPNDNGLRLLSFAAQAGMVVANTCFQHSAAHSHTFYGVASGQGGGERRCTLDYILVSRRFMSGVRDCRVYRGFPAASDHRLLAAAFRLRLCAARGARRDVAAGPALWRLQAEPHAAAAFDAAAASRMQCAAQLAAAGDTEAAWAALCEGAMVAAHEALGSQRPPRPRDRALTAATLQLIDAKQAVWQAMQQTALTTEQRAERQQRFRSLQRAVGAAVARDEQHELARCAEVAAQHWQAGRMSQFAKQVRAMDVSARRRAPGFPAGLRAPDGTVLLTPEAQLREATAQFQQLLVQGGELSPELEARLAALCARAESLAAQPATPVASTAARSPVSPPAPRAPLRCASPAGAAGAAPVERLLPAFEAAAGVAAGRSPSVLPAGVRTRSQAVRRLQQPKQQPHQQQSQQQPQQQPQQQQQRSGASTPPLPAPLTPSGPRHSPPADPPQQRPPPEPPPTAALSAEQMAAPPTVDEIDSTVRSLRNAAAPGADGITASMLKASPAMVGCLHALICLVWQTGKAPMDWKRALLVALYKGKGDARAFDSYRGISLLSIPGKVYAALLLRRVSQHLDAQLLEAQCGFRPKRGLTDAAFTLRQLTARSWEFGTPLHLAFIDLRKAFDSVPRHALWRVLRAYAVPPKLVDLLTDLHTGTQAALRLGALKGEPFSISAGVKQGCVIAPLLFNVYIDFVVRQALERMSTCGVSVLYRFSGSLAARERDPGCATFDTTIPLLMYADDMALTCPSSKELVQFLQCMDDVCAEAGLCINAGKTEVMSVDRFQRDPLPAPIVLRGGAVKLVSKFKYLGAIVTSDCAFDAEISARVGKAAAAFHALQHVWSAPTDKFGVGLKAVVYKTFVRSILLFGSEWWSLPPGLVQRLETFHHDCLRRILGVCRSDRHSREYLYERCSEHPIPALLANHRLRQLGHIVRMTHTRLPKLTLFNGPPAGAARPVGRPRLRWIDLVSRDCATVRADPSRVADCCSDRAAWRKRISSLLPR
jgi:hypothetical protein